tara:strand:+ start:150 stop:326 length:177 start_codon:yes stop_codon:yes gene_type:complete
MMSVSAEPPLVNGRKRDISGNMFKEEFSLERIVKKSGGKRTTLSGMRKINRTHHPKPT